MRIHPAPRPTLRDVARKAGVSHMTVSRALRTPDRVSPDTAARIRHAVAALGYRPDPALSALAAYRSRDRAPGSGHRIAFLDCDGTVYTRAVLDGTAEEAALLGYGVELLRLPTDPRAQRGVARTLYHRGVCGLLFGPSDALRVFEGWDWSAFAAVSLGPLSHSPRLHAVAMDYFDSAVAACDHLERAGARRIGLAIDPALEARSGHRWLGGYAAWSLSRARRVRVSPPEAVRSVRGLRQWAGATGIDGLLTIHAPQAAGLRSRGVRIAFLNPGAALPGQPHYGVSPQTIGREGVRMLHHLLLRREFGIPELPRTVTLRGEMRVDGGSAPGLVTAG